MAGARCRGGENTGKGNYGNFSTGERVSMDTDGLLPGDAATVSYTEIRALILAAGPLLGLIYAAFLPFFGIAMMMKLAFAKHFGRSVEALYRVATFNWSPTEAYLAGRRHTKKTSGEDGPLKEKKMSGKDKE